MSLKKNLLYQSTVKILDNEEEWIWNNLLYQSTVKILDNEEEWVWKKIYCIRAQ